MQDSVSGIRKRIPIRRRLLSAVLLTTTICILAASITGFFCIRWIRNATEEIITKELETNLRKIIDERAGSVDAKLQHYEEDIRYITDSIEDMYTNEEEMRKTGRIFYPPVDTREYALTRAFASDQLTEDSMRDELLFYSNLEKILRPISKENEDLISTIYMGTKDGLLVSYDKYSYMSVPPEGEELVYNYFESEWYEKGMNEDGIFYTDIYKDSMGRGLTFSIGSGFTNNKREKVGVACMDFDLTTFYDDLFSTDLDNGSLTFVLDQKGNVISPESDTMDLKEYTGLTMEELKKLKNDPDGIMKNSKSIYVSVPIKRAGWTLCSCVPMNVVMESIHHTDRFIWRAVVVYLIIMLIILLIAVIAMNKTVSDIIFPLERLRDDIKIISDGDLDYRATVYRNDEIGDITSGMNEMVDRLNFTLNELMSSQQHADAMTRLATLDTLTGIRNKTAFDEMTKLVAEEFKSGEKEFGFAMVDLNNLKLLNDNYGHKQGDIAIKKICRIICDVFDHSPVFRVGGDEFVVFLQGDDYHNIDTLNNRFMNEIRKNSQNKDLPPWERVSAAIGIALYDEKLDSGVDSVLARADKEMYKCKKNMKGIS